MKFEDFIIDFQHKKVVEYNNQVPISPMVSVCIQTYNQANYISQCLESILMQKTNFSYEILVGEDDSQDNTREICISYAKRYPKKIKLFLHHRDNNIKIDNNATGLFNSVYNLFSAKGNYIAYCDGDDLWTDPYKLQQQVEFMKNNSQYILTYHNAKMIDEKGLIIENKLYEKINKDFTSAELQKAITQPIISTWCFRNVLRDIPEELIKTINADNFWISLLGFHGQGKYLDNIGPSHYRIHKSGIWSLIQKDIQLTSKMKTYQNLSQYYIRNGEEPLATHFKKRAYNYKKMLVFHHFKHGNIFKGLFAATSFLKQH